MSVRFASLRVSFLVSCANPSRPRIGGNRTGTATGRSSRKFYEHYRKEVDECDKGFMKKYEEDLDLTISGSLHDLAQ